MSGLLDDYPVNPNLAAQARRIRANRNPAPWSGTRFAAELMTPQGPGDIAVGAALSGAVPPVARIPLAATGLLVGDPGDAEGAGLNPKRVARNVARAGERAAARTQAATARAAEEGWGAPAAPAVRSSARAEDVSRTDMQDRELRAYLDRGGEREPVVRNLPEGEDVLGLRNFDLSAVPNVPQTPLPRWQPPRGVSARMTDLVNNDAVWREYGDLVRNGRDNLLGREWYNMEPLRIAFVNELGEEGGNAAFRHFTQNIAATSPRSNIIDNMRNASYYFTQEASGAPLPMRQPQPYGHLAQNLHRMNVERIRGPGWDLMQNPKPPSFAENLAGNQLPGTMDAHALSVPAILSRDPRFLGTQLRVARTDPETGERGFADLQPRAAYGRGVFTMDEAVRRPQLWDNVPNPNEYGALEARFARLGDELDMTTAQTQASGWVGGGRISGLTSPPLPAVEVFQRVVNRTAQQTGREPQEVLRDFIWRQNALRSLAPVGGAGLGAGLLGGDE
ncbi:hypothetical protein [Microcystis phage MJing1]|nr:hypothetical protein [Microcystis phage MJing1]